MLDRIGSPQDLKLLRRDRLPLLAKEIRQRILEVVSKNGGHLGGPLGAVELAIALHYIYDTPKDKIVWDTGHQSYPHKLLTGRNKNFDTLRQFRGVCGFCNIEESEYDVFGAGHASTAISAALGIAKARISTPCGSSGACAASATSRNQSTTSSERGTRPPRSPPP